MLPSGFVEFVEPKSFLGDKGIAELPDLIEVQKISCDLVIWNRKTSIGSKMEYIVLVLKQGTSLLGSFMVDVQLFLTFPLQSEAGHS